MADLRKPDGTIADAMAHQRRYSGADLMVLQMMQAARFDAAAVLVLPSGTRLQGPYNFEWEDRP